MAPFLNNSLTQSFLDRFGQCFIHFLDKRGQPDSNLRENDTSEGDTKQSVKDGEPSTTRCQGIPITVT